LSEQQEVEGELKSTWIRVAVLYESRSQNDIYDDDDDRSCSENTPVLIAMADGRWRMAMVRDFSASSRFSALARRSDTQQDKV
jgi:hypothetical protein